VVLVTEESLELVDLMVGMVELVLVDSQLELVLLALKVMIIVGDMKEQVELVELVERELLILLQLELVELVELEVVVEWGDYQMVDLEDREDREAQVELADLVLVVLMDIMGEVVVAEKIAIALRVMVHGDVMDILVIHL
jgi:hypothetical protein